jgi:DNA-binding GntR family transcriptional regulator
LTNASASPQATPHHHPEDDQYEEGYERIKMKLIMLDIRPGSPINDGALAAELGVGRTPVRDALKRLDRSPGRLLLSTRHFRHRRRRHRARRDL